MVMYKISIVSYLNSIPFIYGMKKNSIFSSIDLSLDFPSECAEKLLKDKIDIGLVPVVVVPKLREANILSDYCIGSEGKVDTVCIFSDVPIEEIESISLDYQSLTSVKLLKVLLREYFFVNPVMNVAEKGFETMISGKNAALVIGDKAFELHAKHKFIYDLSDCWFKMTGLPFVFACWVANKYVDKNFVTDLNQSFSVGINNIDCILDSRLIKNLNYNIARDYLTNKISYNLDERKKEGMRVFLQKINK